MNVTVFQRELETHCVLFLSLPLRSSHYVEEYRKRWNPFESGDRGSLKAVLLATKEKKKQNRNLTE